MTADEIITAQECRKRLQIGRSTYYERVAAGAIPKLKGIGKKHRHHWPTVLAKMGANV